MNFINISPSFSSLFCLLICGYSVFSQEANTRELYLEPIFHVNYGDATADKPQSKSWTNQYGHWLIVGDGDGPKLLKKETTVWASQFEVNKAWQNLPSRADVYSSGDEAHIVLVGECALNVVQITYSHQNKQY